MKQPKSKARDRADTHAYLFDAKLFVAMRITATSERAARLHLEQMLDCATVTCGPFPGGFHLVGEASLDGELDLLEFDDEPV